VAKPEASPEIPTADVSNKAAKTGDSELKTTLKAALAETLPLYSHEY